jgi:hypothetical protein
MVSWDATCRSGQPLDQGETRRGHGVVEYSDVESSLIASLEAVLGASAVIPLAVLDAFTQIGPTIPPPLPEPPDPNALYAAVIQASATIVAIVGGFVTATVVNIVTERQSIQAQVADLERTHEDAQQEQRAAEEARDRRRAQFLLWAGEEQIVGWGRPLPSAESARERLKANEVPVPLFRDEWERFTRDVEQAIAAIDAYGDHWQDPSDARILSLGTWLQEQATDLSARGGRIASLTYEAMNEAAEKRAAETRDFMHTLPHIPPPDSFAVIEADWARSEHERWERQVDAAVSRAVEAAANARQVALSLERQRARLDHARQAPPDLWIGFFALLILFLGGVVYPLLLMPQRAADFDIWDKSSVLGLFALGMVLSFGYVARLLRSGRAQVWRPWWRVWKR